MVLKPGTQPQSIKESFFNAVTNTKTKLDAPHLILVKKS